MRNLLVKTYLAYLRVLARFQLRKISFWRWIKRKSSLKIIGITGSYGKTSLMKAVEVALKDDFRVKISEKANSETGVPLNILGLQVKDYSRLDWLRVTLLAPLMLVFNWQTPDVYIVEMGVDEPDEPKNMSYLLKIIQPQIGMFLGVSSVHSMQFDRKVDEKIKGGQRRERIMDLIAGEKGRLVESLPQNGYAILNLDDKRVARFAARTKAKIIGVNQLSKSANILIQDVRIIVDEFKCRYRIGNSNYDLRLKNIILPKGYATSFAMAIGVGMALGIDPQKAITGIEKHFKLPAGRSNLIEGIKNTIIIDSSYNASKSAMLEMLDLLADLKKQSRRIGGQTKRKAVAVLGDMREIGESAKIEHEEVAEKAVKICDEIVLVGLLMQEFFLPKAKFLGFKNIFHFDNSFEAGEYLQKNLKSGELILVKGSQNTIFLEIVVEMLMKNKSQAEKLLCRRGKFWDKKREQLKI